MQDEYREASANLRHYSNLRFAQLTIFAAITAGLLYIFFHENNYSYSPFIHAIPAIGLVVVIVFLILELRILIYWDHHKNRTKDLERELGYDQYKTRPEPRYIRGRFAIRLLFAGVSIFWVFIIVSLSVFPIP